jgi:hypothetical protein
VSFEELLLRHAVGQNVAHYEREQRASAVMMIPIPRRGVFRGVRGLDQARAVSGIEDVRITAKADQMLILRRKAPATSGSSSRAPMTPAPLPQRCAGTRATGARHRARSADATIRPWLTAQGRRRRRLHRGTRAAARSLCEVRSELPGLDFAVAGRARPADLTRTSLDGRRKLWEDQVKMIPNEYRLMPWQKEAQELVAAHGRFFFGEGRRYRPATCLNRRSNRPAHQLIRDGNRYFTSPSVANHCNT